MLIDIGGIFAAGLVSRIIGGLIDNFSGRMALGNGRTLEVFLNTLSTDFTKKVEGVIREAFTAQNLLEVKADMTTAATAFRTYAVTAGEDRGQLDVATNKVLDARSRLFATVDSIVGRNPNEYTKEPNPSQRGILTLQQNRALEAAMAALQAIAALDLIVLSKKVEGIPLLKGEVVIRIGEYEAYANRLKESHKTIQTVRRWAHIENARTYYESSGMTHCYLNADVYEDGNKVEKEHKIKFSYSEKDMKKWEKKFTKKWTENASGGANALRERAKQMHDSRGNINEAMTIWTEMKAAFRE